MRKSACYQLVHKILTINSSARDEDDILIRMVWKSKGLLVMGNLRGVDEWYLPTTSLGRCQFSTETIRRTRQKIQEECEDLRGKSYKKRQSHARKARTTFGNSVTNFTRYHE